MENRRQIERCQALSEERLQKALAPTTGRSRSPQDEPFQVTVTPLAKFRLAPVSVMIWLFELEPASKLFSAPVKPRPPREFPNAKRPTASYSLADEPGQKGGSTPPRPRGFVSIRAVWSLHQSLMLRRAHDAWLLCTEGPQGPKAFLRRLRSLAAGHLGSGMRLENLGGFGLRRLGSLRAHTLGQRLAVDE